MKRVISFLFGLTAFVAATIPLTTEAQDLTFLTQGVATQGLTLYCMKKDDAEALAKALVEEDEKVVTEKQASGICHFHGSIFVPVKNVAAYGTEPTLYVHEVESGGGQFYLITNLRIAPKGTRSA